MKLKDIFLSANANLFRNKVRTILTIIAVIVGAFTINITVALNAGVNQYINAQLSAVGAENVLIVVPKQDDSAQDTGPKKYDPSTASQSGGIGGVSGMVSSIGSGGALSLADKEKVGKIAGVETVQANRMPSIDYVEYNSGTKYQISAYGSVNGIKRDILAGSDFTDAQTKEDSPDNCIEIALELVEPLGLGHIDEHNLKESAGEAVGKTVTLQVTNSATNTTKLFTATVNAVLNTSIINGGMSTLNPGLANRIIDYQQEGLPDTMKDQYPMLFVSTPSDYTVDQVNEVKQRLDNAGYTSNTFSEQLGVVKNVIDALTWVLIAFAAIALIAATFGIVNTLFMSVSERTREIGLMKAFGMSRARIFLLFSAEAILIGFWGSLIAIALSIGASSIINAVAVNTFLQGLTGLTLLQYPWQNVAIVTAVLMLIGFLAGSLPARRAANQNPIDALRYE
jgi:putative ABC transport system permease protein